MTHLRIRTPEGVEFALPLAGPVSRALAYMVDLLIVAGACLVLSGILSFASILTPDLGRAAVQITFFVLPIAYGIACEWLWRGQTVGKRVFRLRVVDAAGLKLRPSQVILRNLFRTIDFFPLFYVVGGVSTLVTRHSQRLGDLAAGTVVLRIPPLETPDLEPVLGSRFNSLRPNAHLAARLRQRIDAAEAAVAFEALSRRDELEPAARVELYRELADEFRSRVPYPPEIVEALTDEQYLRNVVDILYRPKSETKVPESSVASH